MLTITITHIKDLFTVFDGHETGLYNGDELEDFFSTYFLNDAKKDTAIIWFFNLSLYAENILFVLHRMGFNDVTFGSPTVSDMASRDYQYIISDDGTAYRIIVKAGHKTTYIYNVDNLLSNISDKEIIKDFGRKIKGDNNIKLAKGTWAAVFLMNGWQERKTPFTLSMLAMREWRKIEGLYNCDNLINCHKFSVGDESLEHYIRKAYHGGWNYLNDDPEITREAREHGGIVYDVNSLYPFIMSRYPMPWGEPTIGKGKISEEILNDKYMYYFIHVKCRFELKEDSFPFVQKKDSMWYWGRDYLETSDIITREGKRVKSVLSEDGERTPVIFDLVLTKTDWELMHQHYTVTDIEYIEYVVFHTCRHVFDNFIRHYYREKKTATETGEMGKRRIAKITMNSVSGGLAKRKQRTNVILKYDENDIVDYDVKTSEFDTPSYIHLAAAILSYARAYTYERAVAYKDRLIYADTDSLHLAGHDKAETLRIDPEELGAWKEEEKFIDAVYYKKKTYAHQLADGSFKCTLAGVDQKGKRIIEDVLSTVDWDNDIFRSLESDYISQLDDEDLEAFDNVPGEIGLRELEKTLRRRLDGEFYDPMYMLQYAEYPSVFQWSENFLLKNDVKWCKIRIS